ncbi:MAG: PHP domain-containing protein, partial [Chloroflexi bacterium]|nr:PHP domain-containing protein [Chloroflexota bacterium]
MAGLHFRKLDLHTHTPASRCYRFPDHTPDQIVQAALEKGLDGIAITDHNTAVSIQAIQTAAQGTRLVIFPGVEISMSEGFHVVALFDPAATQQQVENFLGAIGILAEDYGRSQAICTQSVYTVISKIRERGGLAILAHIDGPKGAFYTMTGERDSKVTVPASCRKLFNEANYHAVEVMNGRLPDGFDAKHQLKRFPAFYQASDNPDPERPTKHSLDGLALRHSWFKLDHIGLEGLRQCFADPNVRIQQMDEYAENAYPRITDLRVGPDGFLRHQKFGFHRGLNSLIGGKGVGKSLAVELLRFGLDQPPEDEDLRRDHLSKLEKRLLPGNSVEIAYEMGDGRSYTIQRTFQGIQNGRALSQVECANGDGQPYAGDIPTMFPILAYSQTEVIKIAEDKGEQLDLIDRFIDKRPFQSSIANLQSQLHGNDTKLAQALKAEGRLDELERGIATLQAQIDGISQTLAHPHFAAMQQAEAKQATFERQRQIVQKMMDETRDWHGRLQKRPLPQPPTDDALRITHHAVEKAMGNVTAVLDNLLANLNQTQQTIQQGQSAWEPEFKQIQAQYNTLLQDQGDQRAQEQRRQQLERQKQAQEREAKRYRRQVANLPGLRQAREELLAGLTAVHRNYFQTRQTKFQQLTDRSDGKLRLTLAHAADHSAFAERLVELLRGGVNAPSVAARRQIAENMPPRQFVELVLARNEAELAAAGDVSQRVAERVTEKLWSHDNFADILALQHTVHPADVPSIKFRKHGGRYDELNELSVGQKCTALLIIALGDGQMPVIIDQPEDALDIVSVWEDVVKKLRRGKNHRQFILTTHNSSVAVGADSDQFIVLKAGARNGRVIASGAIDRPEVRTAVIQHLEGGTEPYELRQLKYNISAR